MPIAAPIRPDERIVSLDIIRGFALLGILVMNLSSFSGSDLQFFAPEAEAMPWWDSAASYFRDVFFAGKFNSLFSLLFAIGFTMQLQRLRAKVPNRATTIYVRRLLILLAIGWLHGCLFWSGDVLSYYAVLGFALLLMRGWSNKAITITAVCCLFYPGIRSAVLALYAPPDWGPSRMEYFNKFIQNSHEAFGGGSFADAAAENTAQMLSGYTSLMLFEFTLVNYVLFFGTMLLGLLVGRHRWIENYRDNEVWIKKLQWLALFVGVVCAAIASYESKLALPAVPSIHWSIYRVTYGLARVCIMVFYVITIVRLAEMPEWRRWMQGFATAGRMPLSNYLLQTVIGTFIFYDWGLGYWGTTGPTVDLLLALAIFFLIQVPLSKLWLTRFNYGPMEWLWRRLTYGTTASTPTA